MESSTWDRFWSQKDDLDSVYRSSPKVVDAILATAPRGSRVLEIGAGTGRDSARLRDAGFNVVALDRSREALALMARATPDRRTVGLVGADALHLPFPDQTFDVVFHQGVLEHFGNPAAFLSENYRVTVPGGLLVVDVPQTYHPWTLIKRVALLFDRWFAGWETEFTIDQLEVVIRRVGYDVVSSYGDWMVPSLGYRLVRHAVREWVDLPLEPRGPETLRRIRRGVRRQALEPRAARYVAHTIGVVARRPGLT